MVGRACLLVVLVAVASPADAATLDYRASSIDCPTASRFSAEVTARLGFSPWLAGGPRVSVQISTGAAGYVGTLVRGPNARTFAAPSCIGVFELLVAATAMALDRVDRTPRPAAARGTPAPHRTASVSAAATPRSPSSPPVAGQHDLRLPDPYQVASDWAFAPRNNQFQIGVMGGTGFGVSGMVPLPIRSWAGRVEASVGMLSVDGGGAETSAWNAHAYYLLPLIYISEGSSFEVPMLFGAGLSYYHL